MLTSDQKEAFIAAATAKFGSNGTITSKQVKELAAAMNMPIPSVIWRDRVSKGTFRIPPSAAVSPAAVIVPFSPPAAKPVSATKFDPNAETSHTYAAIPDTDEFFVPFGDFKTLTRIVASSEFFPVYISGDSGNGKTLMVEQSCAARKRAMIRVQVSRETDEDDLIGGFRLIGGETKFVKGPVIRAMELGAVLLIDELDRADPTKIMCLQGILEGKPYFIKKTGEVVCSTHGFNVIVTANTLGRGASDGRYTAATILDDAFLERMPVTLLHSHPSESIEIRILSGRLCGSIGCSAAESSIVADLVKWANIIRTTFADGGVSDTISTRRLVHIVNTYRLVQSIKTAIELCTNRFDEETKTTFLELWDRVTAVVTPQTQSAPDTQSVPDAAATPASV